MAEFDAVIVGAGPAGLAAALRFKQLNKGFRVCVLEKGSRAGAHSLSGCVLDPRALDELVPGWRAESAKGPEPLRTTPVTKATFRFQLPKFGAVPLPVAPPMRGPRGHCIVSLSDLCRWMAARAEAEGVEVFTGFGADSLVTKEGPAVRGVTIKGAGDQILAPFTLLAEGCRGSLTKQAMERFKLAEGRSAQTYALGIKEVWKVPESRHSPGLAAHTTGWPADTRTVCGGFEYHPAPAKAGGERHVYLGYLGYVVGLDYANPHLDPFEEFQRWKTTPRMRWLLGSGAQCLQYGARCLAEGGPQAVPAVSFPGGALAGCCAGFLDGARLKGVHTAMKTGMLAAEAAYDAASGVKGAKGYEQRVKESWVWQDLRKTRNMKPSFRALEKLALGHGLFPFLGFSALDAYVLRGKAPFTFHSRLEDHQRTLPASSCPPKAYPKPDGLATFDRNKSLFLSGVSHVEGQPPHLAVRDPSLPTKVNLGVFGGVDTRYCPAGVYEYVETAKQGERKLTIHAGNCLACKTCDIKDPTQNVTWTMPAGSNGPSYTIM